VVKGLNSSGAGTRLVASSGNSGRASQAKVPASNVRTGGGMNARLLKEGQWRGGGGGRLELEPGNKLRGGVVLDVGVSDT
jgi:hypothetical protein